MTNRDITKRGPFQRDFLAELKAICQKVTGDKPQAPERGPVTLDTFDEYQIIKRKGNDEKIIAIGLTLNEAKRLSRLLRSRLNILRAPNDDGSPYFELEIYKVTIAGKERHFETPSPRFDPETRWVG